MSRLKPKEIDYIIDTYKDVNSIKKTAEITGFSLGAVNRYVKDMSSKKPVSRDCKNPINQIDLKTGDVIAEWDKPAYAAKALNINPAEICLVLQGKLGQAGGYGWEPKEKKKKDK